MPKNFRVLMLIGLLLAPVTAQAADVGNRVPTSGSTVLSDAEMDKAHGKDAPYELAPLLLIPGVGEAALAAAAAIGAAALVYAGSAAIYNAVTNNGSSSTVDTANRDKIPAKNNNQSENKKAAYYKEGMTPAEKREFHDLTDGADGKGRSKGQMAEDRARVKSGRK